MPAFLIVPRTTGDAGGAGSSAAASSNSNRASAMSARRRLRSRSSTRRRSRRTGSGVSGGSAFQSGALLSTATSTSATSSPSNARRPVSISYSTQPNAQMSLRLSTALPRACSGLMYAAVPSSTPTPVIIAGDVIVGDAVASMVRADVGSSAFARPKSSTFTVPSGRTFTLAGFRSRWMMPCSCAASSASAICLAIGNASSTGIGPCAMRSASVGPSTSSMTSACTPSDCSRP